MRDPWVRFRIPILLGILVAGIATRLYPVSHFAVWGSDSGEYVYLTERLVATGRISFDYDGWGLAYPYFPGMFVLDGALLLVLGGDVLALQKVAVPALAGLLPLLVYLIARRVAGDERVALLAGAFLAVTAPHVLVTSHAMPGTVGHLFLLGSLLTLLLAYREPRWAWLLPLFGGALLLTHHLTLYFLVGAVAAIALLRELVRGTPDAARLRIEAPLALALAAGAGLWWLGVADRFRDEIVGDVLGAPWWAVAGLAYALLLAGPPLAVLLRRRFAPAPARRPAPPTPSFVLGSAAAVAGAFLLGVGSFLVVPIPGGDMRIHPPTLVYFPPVVVFLAFLLAGRRAVRAREDGAFVGGWSVAILASLAFAIATDSRVLFPFRHVEYILEPIAIYVAAGVVAAVDLLRPGTPRRWAAVAVALALVSGALASSPPRETIANFEEGMTWDELRAVEWAGANLPADAVVAADHRASSLLFGIAKRNATFDYAYRTFHGATVAEAVPELRSLSIPGNDAARITHVFLSPQIRAGVALEQFANAEPMSEAAQAKFEDPRYFTPVYGDPTARTTVSILEVEWSAIDRDFPP